MKAIILITCFSMFLLGCSTQPKKDSKTGEWRLPDKEDVIDDWARFNSPNKVIDDFNGDGKKDVAQIFLKKDSNTGYMLGVNLSDGKNYTLEQNENITPQSVSIELVEPSGEVWESACAKGYWDCSVNEIRQFKISKPSIQFCYIESSCMIFMWSDRNSEFTRIPLSD